MGHIIEFCISACKGCMYILVSDGLLVMRVCMYLVHTYCINHVHVYRGKHVSWICIACLLWARTVNYGEYEQQSQHVICAPTHFSILKRWYELRGTTWFHQPQYYITSIELCIADELTLASERGIHTCVWKLMAVDCETYHPGLLPSYSHHLIPLHPPTLSSF